jgi:hypothetical protein
MKYLSECDLLVYDLHSGNPKDVELALAALKKYNFEEEKVLILISSLMVWNRTPAKMREVKEGGGFVEEGGAAAEGGEQPPADGEAPADGGEGVVIQNSKAPED